MCLIILAVRCQSSAALWNALLEAWCLDTVQYIQLFWKSAQELRHHYTLCSGSNDLQCHCYLPIFIITCIFPPLTQQVCLWKATTDLRLGFTVLNASYVNKVNGNTQRAVFLIISFKRSLLLKYVLTSALSFS